MELPKTRVNIKYRTPSVSRNKNSQPKRNSIKDLILPSLGRRRSVSPYACTLKSSLVINKPKPRKPSTTHNKLLNTKFLKTLAKLSGGSSSTATSNLEATENPVKDPEISTLNTSEYTPCFKIDEYLKNYLDADLTSEFVKEPQMQFRESVEIRRGRIVKLEFNEVVVEEPHLMPLDSESPKFCRHGSTPFDLDDIQPGSKRLTPTPVRAETRASYVRSNHY